MIFKHVTQSLFVKLLKNNQNTSNLKQINLECHSFHKTKATFIISDHFRKYNKFAYEIMVIILNFLKKVLFFIENKLHFNIWRSADF
jgi:hypothetical protein